MQNRRFPSKIALHLKKVCYKVSLCEYCQQQSFKAFIGLSTRSKMVRGRRLLLCENLPETDCPFINVDFQSIFARCASDVTPIEKIQLTRIGSPLVRAFQ